MKLPEIAARPQRAERPSLDTVRPTDLGLGAVAQNMGPWIAEVERTQAVERDLQRAQDAEAVKPLLEELQTGFEQRFAEAGASWDGVSPGFARGIAGELDTAASSYLNREGLTPGQRDALARGVTGYKTATSQRAIQYQAQRRGQLAAEQTAARDATVMGGYMATYTEGFSEKKRERDQAYDGSTEGYAAGVLADHDAVAAGIIETAPEALRPRLTQQMASRRLALQGAALDVEARAEQAFVATTATQGAAKLVNGILTDPSAFEGASETIDQLAAGLPAAARPEALARWRDQAAEARIDGLIRAGEIDTADGQLNGGTLDGWMQPDTKARLLGRLERARDEASTADWVAKFQMSQAVDDDLASLASTGVGGSLDLNALAQTLGPREAAQYAMQADAAREAHAATAGFGRLTPAQIQERVESQRPTPGQAGYAQAEARYVAAQRAAQAELKARQDDPGGWAMRQSPDLQRQAAQLGAGDPATARTVASQFGGASALLQQQAGIPGAERRLLPKATAAAIVQQAIGNADPANGLRMLGQMVEAFAPPPGANGQTVRAAVARQRMVADQLVEAGAQPADMAAAIDLADDPVRLGRYIGARRSGAFSAMDRRDKTAVEDAVARELEPYVRSFAGFPVSGQLTQGRRDMAEIIAGEGVANGRSPAQAAREAVTTISGRYRFVGPGGWRMPAGIADRREGGGLVIGSAGSSDTAGRDGQSLAQRGASRVMSAVMANDGAGLYAPADQGTGLTEDQRRRRYADSVNLRARWMTTPDDAGLVLMRPDLDGRWTPVLDRRGGVIQRSWDQLIAEGRRR